MIISSCRNCRQVEILRVNFYVITLRDLAELEHRKNMNQVRLCWTDSPSLTQVLPILKRCTNLRRITLNGGTRLPFPSSEELCEFIMNLKHLTFLHIIYGNSTCNHFKSEVDQVKALVFPRRPNFTFYVSCCYEFRETRAGSCVFS